MIYGVPTLIRKLMSDVIWSIPSKDKVYLTFDDGPVPEATPFVLDMLKKYGMKATFFCVGENIAKYPELYNRILTEGHAVGNHTYNHLNGWKTSRRTYIENVAKSRSVTASKLYRPPYGKLTPSQYATLKKDFKIVMWDVLSGDYNQKLSPDECYENVVSRMTEGSVIVFHDSVKALMTLRVVLPKILEYIVAEGWTSDMIDEEKMNLNENKKDR